MIFFFDIDGVFTSHRANVGHLNLGGKMAHYDQYAVNMINTLGKASNAECVIISSKRFTDATIATDIKQQEIKVRLHEDWKMPKHANPAIHEKGRGDLIREWCKKHHVSTDKILIFDDENCGYTDELSSRFVKSNIREGFSFDNFMQCMDILGLSMEECRTAQQQLKNERNSSRNR